jgi:hypothetical protein
MAAGRRFQSRIAASVPAREIHPHPARPLLVALSTAWLLLALELLCPQLGRADAAAAEYSWWRPSETVPGVLGTALPEEIEEVPDDSTLEAQGALVGEIYIRRLDVFDPSRPDEDRAIFRTANRLHVTTREGVIEGKLLFATGEPYARWRLQETERALRALDYLYDAWVGPVRYRDGVVDVLVVTRDVWTLGVSAGFQRSGGASEQHFEVVDSNFLGSGRFLTVRYQDEPDRTSYRFRFHDTALLGTRGELRVLLSDNSDGHRRTVDVERPFYSLDTRWALGARLVSDDRAERVFRYGEVVRIFRQEESALSIYGGLSSGYRQGQAHRWLAGYTYSKSEFSRHPKDPRGPRFPANIDRTHSYPWLGFQRVSDRYIEARNLDQLGRTEDFNLGSNLQLRLGWSSPSLGATQEQLIFDLALATGFAPGQRQLVLLRTGANGRRGSDRIEGTVASLELDYFLRTFGSHQFYAHAEGRAGWHMDPERQLLLGGDNGLRGYTRKLVSGDRLWLVTLEQRFYSDLHLFGLVYVGGAAFFDVGRAWHTRGPLVDRDPGILRDVGLGLRLSSSRSSQGKMVHFDVAYPLDGDRRKVQWLVVSKESF